MSKHVRVFCPNCRNEVRVPPEHMGEMGVCKHCNQPFRPRAYVRLACPGCQSSLDIRKEYMGRTVTCKHCSQGFVAEAPGTSSDLATVLPGETPAVLGVAKPRPTTGSTGDANARQLKVAAADTTRLREVLESAQTWKRRAEAAEQERDKSRAERDSTRAERDVLQLRLGQIEALAAEHESALHEVYEATNAECVALLSEVETERQARVQLEAARDALESDLEALRSESSAIQAELAEARQHHAEADFRGPEVVPDRQAEIDQLTRDLALAREQADAERQSRERLEAARAGLEADLDALRSESSAIQAELAEARQHHAEADFQGPEVGPDRQAEIDQLTRDLALAREREDTERQSKERFEAARAGLEADLETLRREGEVIRNDLIEAQRLHAEADSRRPEVGPDRQAEIDQLTRDLALAQERENTEREANKRLESARTRLESDLASIRRDGESYRADLIEAWRRLAETDARLAEVDPEKQAEIEQLKRDLALAQEREVVEREARERLEAARAELESDLEAHRGHTETNSRGPEVGPDRQAEIDQLTRDLAHARERENAERQAREQLEAARVGLESDLEAFSREGEGIRNELVEAQRRLAEADSRRPEIEQLARDLALARQREDEANRQVQPLAERARTLVEELDHEKAERERENAQYRRILAHLEKEVEAANARASKPSKPEPRLSEAIDRLRAATERGDRLEIELQTTRARLTSVSRDLALAQLYDDDANDDRPASEHRSEELKESQLRIVQLIDELRRANQTIQKLRDTLDGIGIRFT